MRVKQVQIPQHDEHRKHRCSCRKQQPNQHETDQHLSVVVLDMGRCECNHRRKNDCHASNEQQDTYLATKSQLHAGNAELVQSDSTRVSR